MINIPGFSEKELLDILCKLIKCKSENGIHKEEAVAHCIQNILKINNIKSKLSYASEGRPNILAKIKGKYPGPTFLYNGHLDVVPVGSGWKVDPYGCEIKEGKLFGRGTADMKSGVSAMIYAAILLNRTKNFFGEILLIFYVDEENINLGMRHLLKNENISADYAIISEPSDLNVCIAHKGVARYRIKTKGIAGHAAFIDNPKNAINNMTKVLLSLINLSKVIKEKFHPILGNASLSITKIWGGSAINIIPAECFIEIDRRTLPGETQQSCLDEIKEALSNLNIDVDIDNYLFIAASYIDQNNLFVKKLANTVEKVIDKSPLVTTFKATCEAPFLSIDKNIPTIIFGPGSLKQAHIKDEFVEISQVLMATKVFYELPLTWIK